MPEDLPAWALYFAFIGGTAVLAKTAILESASRYEQQEVAERTARWQLEIDARIQQAEEPQQQPPFVTQGLGVVSHEVKRLNQT